VADPEHLAREAGWTSSTVSSPAQPASSGTAAIRLERLTKHYPSQERPAVAELTMDIPAGEIVILVGPSGCGKTTTLKMINRLVEPTSGRIYLQGEDVTASHPDTLRRRIGYVIQQVGLFPHMTVGANISVVPRMLGWDKRRIADRVDELLDLVGLDPARYRGRYPKELSGGQQQRVGVARALGADPPVMLMDEPFGAIDPITRDRLQNELLRLQDEIKKTIVFVTHDIDEAIKMGDRIAILHDESRIAQFDTPAEILTNPAGEFVEEFIGAAASVKRLSLTKVADVEVDPWPTVDAGTDVRGLAASTDRDFLLVLDRDRRPRGWLARKDADRWSPDSSSLPVLSPVTGGDTLLDALNSILKSYSTCAVVVDHAGTFRGTLGIERIRTLIHEHHEGGAAEPAPAGSERRRSR